MRATGLRRNNPMPMKSCAAIKPQDKREMQFAPATKDVNTTAGIRNARPRDMNTQPTSNSQAIIVMLKGRFPALALA